MIVTTGQIYRGLKLTLDSILTDPTSAKSNIGEYFDVGKMEDAYVEEAEFGGPLLLQEKPEGAAAAIGDMSQGGVVRFTARTMALHLHATEEAVEDCKYEKILNFAKRLSHSSAKTQDYDGANTIIRSTTAAATGGTDAVCLASASHVLPTGATWSNLADTYQTPSQAALIAARVKCGKYPSQNGLIEGNMIEAIVCTLFQEAVWEAVIGSDKVTGSNFNDINVVKKYKLKIIANKYLDGASATQWGCLTDADEGLKWKWRVKPESRTWVDNDASVLKYGIRYREAHGWSDARCWYQGNV